MTFLELAYPLAEKGWVSELAHNFYYQCTVPFVVITALLAWHARPSAGEAVTPQFRHFRAVYLCVWFLCAAGDWLQGPYVYVLCSAYGFARSEIAQLFVAGFASSLVCSFFVGALCDRCGRKRCAMAYCVIYIFSCLTKHVNSYAVLMVGRLTGGMATSLLFSDFECWLVSEHTCRHKFSVGLLSYMFGMMYTINYCAAILSGIAGELMLDFFPFKPLHPGSVIYFGGPLGPYDLASTCLVVALILIAYLWHENRGSGEDNSAPSSAGTTRRALWLLRHDVRVFAAGVAAAAFEGSMYALVFNWTPALANPDPAEKTPYGLILALFMMASMSGASASTLLSPHIGPAWRLLAVFAVAGTAMAVSAAVTGRGLLRICFTAFIVFEFCIGVYFPAIGVLKSQVVPERMRGTVYNLYRIPLNAVVVGLLLPNLSIVQVFTACVGLLLLGLACTLLFIGRSPRVSECQRDLDRSLSTVSVPREA